MDVALLGGKKLQLAKCRLINGSGLLQLGFVVSSDLVKVWTECGPWGASSRRVVDLVVVL